MKRLSRALRLAWCVLIVLCGAPPVHAIQTQDGANRLAYLAIPADSLAGSLSSGVPKTITLAASASDTIKAIRKIAGDPSDPGVDSLGCATGISFSSTTGGGTFYWKTNTRLSNADTLNTAIEDSLRLPSGPCAGTIPVNFAWMAFYKASASGDVITWYLECHKRWFRW